MGFFSKLNPIKAVKDVVNVFKPGGSVLGKIYDAGNNSVGAPLLNSSLKSSAQLVKGTSDLVGKVGGGGKIGDFGRHWSDMASKDVADQRRTFINAGKVAGSIVGGGMLAPAAGAAAGGGMLGGAAAGATMGAVGGAVAGQGAEGIAKGAGIGGLTGGMAAGLGPTNSIAGSMGQGAIKGGVNAALGGGSVAEGALTGAASGGTNQALGGGFLGGLGSKIIGSALNNQFANKSTGGDMPDKSFSDNINWQDVLAGGVGAWQNNQAFDDTKDQITGLQGLYGQNSPYAQQLRQTLERKDAASGRRSQYGTREVELQARLAENAARLAPTLATMGTQASSQRSAQYNNLLTALRGSGIPQSLLGGIQSYIKGLGGSPTDMGIGPVSSGYSSAADSQAAYDNMSAPDWAGSPQLNEFEDPSWGNVENLDYYPEP